MKVSVITIPHKNALHAANRTVIKEKNNDFTSVAATHLRFHIHPRMIGKPCRIPIILAVE